MAGKILSIVFWLVAAGLVIYASIAGRWALLVPASVVAALFVFALDVFRHREIIGLDRDLGRTLLHVLSAVAVAATFMYWMGRMLFGGS